MFTQKFKENLGEVTQLDAAGKSIDIADLTQSGAKLIPAEDYGLEKWGNPDGVSAQGLLTSVPAVTQAPPIRGGAKAPLLK